MRRNKTPKSVSRTLGRVLAVGAILALAPLAPATVVYQAVNQTDPKLNIGGDILSISSTFSTNVSQAYTVYESQVFLNLSPSPATESNQFDEYAQFAAGAPNQPTPLFYHEIGPSDPFGSGTSNSGLIFEFDNVFAAGGGGGSEYEGNFPPPPFGDYQIGLALTLSDGLTHYAWIDYLTTSESSGQIYGDNFYGYVTGFAYETQPNTPILSSQIPVPEPATGGIAMTAAAVGIVRRRSKR